MINYQVCSYCIMDSTDIDIKFDEIGRCNHCKDYFTKINTQIVEEDQKRARFTCKQNQRLKC